MYETIVAAGEQAIGERDIDPVLDLEAEIGRLREELNAVILAHYYQDGEIQDLADFVGDSLDLSRRAAATDAEVIVFCGVRFMAEVAKILSPSKTVLLPDAEAGCSLEESCQPEPFRRFREQHPDHLALTYINCSAEVKALSDIIVTSSNAADIIARIPEDRPILFAPDHHLGRYLMRQSGREMTLWPGTCIVHEQFSEREIVKLKVRYPEAKVAAHPECPDSILALADHIGSTRSILDFAITAEGRDFIIATEPGIIHQMEKRAPHRRFIPAPGAEGECACNICPFMALNTLEKLYLCMVNMATRVEIAEPLRAQALKPLQRMLEMSPPVPAAAAAE